ncbi:MAG TPA: DUF3108 domain-containing protein [Gammaproteobacteria bacterium]|nr:DUF3108 domain-containing protein [Gammaproteobacteria bacterium]
MTRTMLNALLLVCGLTFMLGDAQAAEPHIPLYHASYSASRNDLRVGTAAFSLTRNQDGSYTYQSVTRPSGLAALFFSDVITESSQFGISNGKPQPLLYNYRHSGNDHDKPERIRFDWTKHTAASGTDKQCKTLPIHSGIYDRALAQLAISLDLAAGKLADTYQVLDHGRIIDYRMQHGSDTKLETPDGTYQVIEVARKDPKKNRTTTFWLAPKLDYLPVQIQQTEPGKATITLTLTEIKFDVAK